MRRSYCYNDFVGGQCTDARAGNATRKECCCSLGAGWSSPCNLCPRPSDGESDIQILLHLCLVLNIVSEACDIFLVIYFFLASTDSFIDLYFNGPGFTCSL